MWFQQGFVCLEEQALDLQCCGMCSATGVGPPWFTAQLVLGAFGGFLLVHCLGWFGALCVQRTAVLWTGGEEL